MKQYGGRWIVLLASLLMLAVVGSAQERAVESGPAPEYTLAAKDVVNVTVWEHAELSGKLTVQPDGDVTLPLVGRVKAGGLTVREFEAALTKMLADGFIRSPRVSVALEEVRALRVFVFGNVGAPGAYSLTEGQTLIEILAKAGYGNAAEAVIVRQASGTEKPPVDQNGDPVIRVNLRELEKAVEQGSLARNVALHDGDTIFVPRVDPTRIFVSGKVRNPGAYPITDGTTVLQALALAGGPTEEAAVNRLRIVRLVNGKQKSIKAKLTDLLQPGDTLLVPERFF